MEDARSFPLYVYCTSKKTEENPHASLDFVVTLNPPIVIKPNEIWKCALMECNFGNAWEMPSEQLEIYCDIIKQSMINNTWDRILRKTNKNTIFPIAFFKTVDQYLIKKIHILIRGENKSFPSRLPLETNLTICIKREII